jgi:hypothetical protein
MAGGYSLSAAGITIANAAVTLAFINPPAAPNVDLGFRRFWWGQSNNMASAQQRWQIHTQLTTFPTLTSATPSKLANADSASLITGGTAGAAGTCGINASAEGTTAGRVVLFQSAENVINGHLMILIPDEATEMAAGTSTGLGYNFPVAPGTLTNWAFGFTWVEG